MTASPARRRRGRAAVATGLILLVAFVGATRCLLLTSSTNMWDSVDYLRNIHRFLEAGAPHFVTLELGHPLYAYLCGWTYQLSVLLGGPADVAWAGKLMGILITASSLVPFYWLCRALLRQRGWSLMACAVYAVVPLGWWWAGEIMSDAAGVAMMLWALGPAALWLEGRSPAWLAAGSLLLGAAVLVRLGTLTVLPVFVVLAALGAGQRRRWAALLWLALIPVPAGAAIGYQLWHSPDRSLAGFLALSPQNRPAVDSLGSLAQWARVHWHYLNALGPVGFFAAVFGLAAAFMRRPGLLALALLWMLPVLYFQLTKADTQIRYCLPVMPVAALATAFLLQAMTAMARGRELAAVTAGVLLAAAAAHALPNAEALHQRRNALEVVARWYRQHTPPTALIVARPEFNHVLYFSHRPALRFDPESHGHPWEKTGDEGPLTLAMTTRHVDAALAAGRPVFVSDLMGRTGLAELGARYEFTLAGELGSRRAKLRNGYEPGFDCMGTTWRRPRRIRIYRLTAGGVWPPPAPAAGRADAHCQAGPSGSTLTARPVLSREVKTQCASSR